MRLLSSVFPERLRRNTAFRRLWLSQLISNFGDWVGLLAGYTLVLTNPGAEMLLGVLIIIKMMSFAVFSPFGGFLSDRFKRRTLMIITDVGRAVVVLSFIFAAQPGWLWLLFVGTALQMFLSAIFEPARSALLPDIVDKADLTSANVITSATWSIVFAVGMGVGGLATDFIGITGVFLFNAASYLVSGWFIYTIKEPGVQLSRAGSNPLKGIVDGARYLSNAPKVRYPVFVKAASSLFLGGLVYAIVLVGERKLQMGAFGIGLLYMSRGIGTGFGPVLGRFIFPKRDQWLSAFGLFFSIAGLSYALCTVSYSIFWLLGMVALAHAASAAGWVLSTVLVQEYSDEAFRGRVFGLEWLLFTVANSLSTGFAAILLSKNILSLEGLLLFFGTGMILSGIVWMTFFGRKKAHSVAESNAA